MGEERQQTQNRDDLELELVRLVGDALWKRVQAQKQNTDDEDHDDEKYRHHRHKDVAFARPRDEGRQMVRCNRVELIRHFPLSAQHANPAWK